MSQLRSLQLDIQYADKQRYGTDLLTTATSLTHLQWIARSSDNGLMNMQRAWWSRLPTVASSLRSLRITIGGLHQGFDVTTAWVLPSLTSLHIDECTGRLPILNCVALQSLRIDDCLMGTADEIARAPNHFADSLNMCRNLRQLHVQQMRGYIYSSIRLWSQEVIMAARLANSNDDDNGKHTASAGGSGDGDAWNQCCPCYNHSRSLI